MDDQKVSEFQRQVLQFYEQHGRDLAWRETTSVYAIAVSELMLQQTQVSRVVEKYEEFLRAFPTPQALADASFKQVLLLWQGLGYNRRARYAQNVASLLVEVPAPSYEQLLAVKGVGPYTAAAICVFAYNADRAAIDVNVRRVHKRFFGSEATDAFIASCVPSGRSRDWHNALMDFGSLVCTKKSPSCEQCPLNARCWALAEDAFSQESSASQPRFKGSVRWHRGQVLKKCLDQPRGKEALWSSLDEQLRDRSCFSQALSGLVSEGFVRIEDAVVRVVE